MYNNLSGYEDGLVGYWNFNDGEGSTLTDLSGSGNHGTIYGATWSDDVMQPLYTGPEWYVSTEGSDDNNGSYEYPFASIQHAVDAANDYDLVEISPGEYFENVVINQTLQIGGNYEEGDIIVNGIKYEGYMENMGLYSDEVADVMNYILNSWGNKSDEIITKERVAKISE